MGIYYGRGLEDLIVLSRDITEDDLAIIKEIPNIIIRGKEMIGETRICIVVVDMKDADDRLLETSYYKCQKDNCIYNEDGSENRHGKIIYKGRKASNGPKSKQLQY